jgi:hypothetical protein
MSCGRCARPNGFGHGRAPHGGRGGCWGGGVYGLAGARGKPQSGVQQQQSFLNLCHIRYSRLTDRSAL